MPEPDALPDLFRRTAEGSRAALDGIFRLEHRRLFGYLRRLAGCATDADDLVQTTFVDLWRYRQRLAQCESPRAYLYSVATRTWQRQLRKAQRRRDRFDDVAREGVAREWEWRSRRDPGVRAEAAELNERLERALESLPVEQRVALVLHRFEGFSTRRIAEMFGVSPKTIESRLRLALPKVMTELTREEAER